MPRPNDNKEVAARDELHAHVQECMEQGKRVEIRLTRLEAQMEHLVKVYDSMRAGIWTLAGAGILSGAGLVFALLRLVAKMP